MTKQYQDLFQQFSKMSGEDQIAKIRELRHRRSIERPAAARKRVVKEAKQKRTKMDKAKTLLKKLSPQEIADLKQKLGG